MHHPWKATACSRLFRRLAVSTLPDARWIVSDGLRPGFRRQIRRAPLRA
jgi:hypothetical protein